MSIKHKVALVLFIFGGAIFFGTGCKKTEDLRSTVSAGAQKQGPEKVKQVSKEYVCMTQDSVFQRKLSPVVVNGKTYFGCCQGCVKAMKENPKKYCYSRDPVTDEIVDKAEAFIMNFRGKALYFKGEENAKKFAQSYGL